MAHRNRPILRAQLAQQPMGSCPPGWRWVMNDYGQWQCERMGFSATGGGTAGPILPPRHPYWRSKLALNPGPVNPFPYPGADVIVSMPVDPFAYAQRQHRRRVAARAKKTARYNATRRVLGL